MARKPYVALRYQNTLGLFYYKIIISFKSTYDSCLCVWAKEKMKTVEKKVIVKLSLVQNFIYVTLTWFL